MAPADATSAGRDDSERQHPRVALSADRNVSVAQCQGAVTSTADTSEGRNVSGPQRESDAPSGRRYVSGPQRQGAATSASRNVSGPQRESGATSASRSVRAHNVGAAPRQSAETSAWRKACLLYRRRRTRPFSRNDGTKHMQTVQKINTSYAGSLCFGLIPATLRVLPRPVYWN